ncbi:MAG TPA: sodium:proton antiporter [Marmoricola sp.]|nr:sodium:proton antiporter [Marmoricola sp.]
MLQALVILLVVTALFAWFNERTLRLPTTVGVALAGATASAVLIGLDAVGVAGARGWAENYVASLNFTEFVLGGILSALLFAGALSLDAHEVWRQRRSIAILSVGSTLISTALIGVTSYFVFEAVGLHLPLVWALLFGALISPTDPVAVLDLLKRANVPARFKTLVAGESLFNDGVGIVLFLSLAAVAGTTRSIDAGAPFLLFARETGGGLLFGLVLGYLGYYLTRTIENAGTEVLITLSLVVGGYAAAATMHVSGPLAMVVAGLVISWHKDVVFGPQTRELVEGFWELVDESLNVILFTLIGLDVILAEFNPPLLLASGILIVVALVARFLSVAIPLRLVERWEGHHPWTSRLLTWAGLRGGIAIGLALSLPRGDYRDLVLAPTFTIVLFTIVVQGLTVMRVVRRAAAAAPV